MIKEVHSRVKKKLHIHGHEVMIAATSMVVSEWHLLMPLAFIVGVMGFFTAEAVWEHLIDGGWL